jgi:hypothetical protein
LPSGNEMACDFCPTCGTRIFHRHLENKEIISIKPGTLDNTKMLDPSGHIWTKSAQQWINLKNNSLQYSGNPDSYDKMIELFSCDSSL